MFWVQLLPTANPGGSCKKGVRLTLPRPGVQIGVLVVGLLGYRHTVTQERDPYVRLRVRTNNGVEVPIGQNTGCP